MPSYKILGNSTELENFLGTFAGTPAEIDINKTTGLGRIFKDTSNGFATLGAGWVDHRITLVHIDKYCIGSYGYSYGEGYQNIGRKYHQKGDVYFNTVKTFTHTPDAYGRSEQINCFGYAISTLGTKLKDIAKKPIEELISNVTASIDETVREYFVPVHDRPQDGDLVVYYAHSNVATHAGIYREVPDFSTGVVESK